MLAEPRTSEAGRCGKTVEHACSLVATISLRIGRCPSCGRWAGDIAKVADGTLKLTCRHYFAGGKIVLEVVHHRPPHAPS